MTVDAPRSPLSAADAPLPERESYSSLTTYEYCPRRYAFRYVEHLPGEVAPGQFAFGSAIHKAFEVFVRERIRAGDLISDRQPPAKTTSKKTGVPA